MTPTQLLLRFRPFIDLHHNLLLCLPDTPLVNSYGISRVLYSINDLLG